MHHWHQLLQKAHHRSSWAELLVYHRSRCARTVAVTGKLARDTCQRACTVWVWLAKHDTENLKAGRAGRRARQEGGGA